MSNQKIVYMNNKVKDTLDITHPYFLDEWDYVKNNNLGIYPYNLTHGSSVEVWWRCDNNHSYKLSIHSKIHSYMKGCIYCNDIKLLEGYNDFETKYPEFKSLWDYEKNDELGIYPNKIKYNATKPLVWWKYDCGHSYQCSLYDKVIRNRCKNCPICSNKILLKGKNDLLSQFPNLIVEWDYEKNDDLLPSEVLYGSNKYAWWKCKYGHSWKARICDRTRLNYGCPTCSGHSSLAEIALLLLLKNNYIDVQSRVKISGLEYDIFIPSLNLLIEYNGWSWHKDKVFRDIKKYENALENNYNYCCIIEHNKNDLEDINKSFLSIYNFITVEVSGKRSLYNICVNSLSKMYKLGFLDKLIIVDKNIDFMAREYLNKMNFNDSLLVKRPDIAVEWHPFKNGLLKPSQFSCGSNYKIWWLGKCGHEWEATICHRALRGDGCPICSSNKIVSGLNDLKTISPDLLCDWDYEKNKQYGIFPDKIAPHSVIKAWWRCKNGHSYACSICNKQSGRGCPICANKVILKGYNDLASQCPDSLLYWDFDKNIIKPEEVYTHSIIDVNWFYKDFYWEDKIVTVVDKINKGKILDYIDKLKRLKRAESYFNYYNGMIDLLWLSNYLVACDYFFIYNNLSIRKYGEFGGIDLWHWIFRQRRAYKNNKLSSLQIKLLDNINMVWNVD